MSGDAGIVDCQITEEVIDRRAERVLVAVSRELDTINGHRCRGIDCIEVHRARELIVASSWRGHGCFCQCSRTTIDRNRRRIAQGCWRYTRIIGVDTCTENPLIVIVDATRKIED